jgi:hypothetical protein
VQPVQNFVLSAVCIAAMSTIALNAQAALDITGQPQPPTRRLHRPAGGPHQALTDLLARPEANEGARENGRRRFPGEAGDREENVLKRGDQTSFNYPTNG